MSPSTRRAWIEIEAVRLVESGVAVALHPEGVDRNCYPLRCELTFLGRPPPGGRG